jgi:hypothetical protein
MKLIFKSLITIITFMLMLIFHIIGIIWSLKLNPYIGCDFKDYKATSQTYNDFWKQSYINVKNILHTNNL